MWTVTQKCALQTTQLKFTAVWGGVVRLWANLGWDWRQIEIKQYLNLNNQLEEKIKAIGCVGISEN